MVGQAADGVFGITSHQDDASQSHEASRHAHEDGCDSEKDKKFRVQARRCRNRHTPRIPMARTQNVADCENGLTIS